VARDVAVPDHPLAVGRHLTGDQPDRLARDLALLARRPIPGVELVDAALGGGVDQVIRGSTGPVREAHDGRTEPTLPQRFGVGHAAHGTGPVPFGPMAGIGGFGGRALAARLGRVGVWSFALQRLSAADAGAAM